MNVHSGTIVAKDDPLVLGTDPVPARYYYDPEWYELERKSIFMRSWINVGHVCELPEPGSFIRRELEFAAPGRRRRARASTRPGRIAAAR